MFDAYKEDSQLSTDDVAEAKAQFQVCSSQQRAQISFAMYAYS